MLNGDGSENGKKTSMSNSQNITLRVQHTLFAVVLHDYNVNLLLVTRFMQGMSYVFLFAISLFTAAHFHLSGR